MVLTQSSYHRSCSDLLFVICLGQISLSIFTPPWLMRNPKIVSVYTDTGFIRVLEILEKFLNFMKVFSKFVKCLISL